MRLPFRRLFGRASSCLTNRSGRCPLSSCPLCRTRRMPVGRRAKEYKLGMVDNCELRVRSCSQHPCIAFTMNVVRWIPIAFIVAIIAWGYYAYVIELCFNTVENWAERICYLIPAHVLFVLFLWAYLKTIYTPVGEPDKNWHLAESSIAELDGATWDTRQAVLGRHLADNSLIVHTRDYQHGFRYCEKCECLKPDRSHHCSICGHCVLKFDHHCPWVNTCVNFNNYKYFIQFLGYALAMCAFSALTDLRFFIAFWTDGAYKKADSSKFHVLFLFFCSAMFAVSVSTLFFYHIWLTLKNRSTIESFRSNLFTWGEDKNGFNLGAKNNFFQIFGRDRWIWLLPVWSSIGTGLDYRTAYDAPDQHRLLGTRRYEAVNTELDSSDDEARLVENGVSPAQYLNSAVDARSSLTTVDELI